MGLSGAIVLIVMAILASWKAFDLIFGIRRRLNEKTLSLYEQFFAELVWKTIKKEGKWTEAPESIYNWMRSEFQGWAKDYEKKLLKKK